MKVVILSAGIGSRLKPITAEKPKCLVNVCNQPILKHQIDLFIDNKNIDEIIIVIGYKADLVRNLINTFYRGNNKITLVENKEYLTTNNMYSLFLTREYINNSFLLINGDVILDSKIVDGMLSFHSNDAVAVDVGVYYEESMKVIESEGILIDISKKISEQDALGCSIDFYKFSDNGTKIFFNKIEEIINNKKQVTLWTEIALKELFNNKELKMKAFNIEGKKWVEIDNFEDLYNAELMFNKNLNLLKEKQVFFFDLDGTLYLEDVLFKEVKNLLELLKTQNKKFFLLSNNSSISTDEYYNKLRNLGLEITRENIIISTHPTIHYLKENDFKRIFVLGTKSLESEFINEGFEITDINPEILVLAFDKELTYNKLEKAAYFLQNNLPYIATHPDKRCPTQKGYIPDAGSVIALLYESTGRRPQIFGKPNKEMLLYKLNEIGYSPKIAVIIGDRLYTDIRMGIEAGITSICVLSGETSREMIERSEFKPDIILKKATDLINILK